MSDGIVERYHRIRERIDRAAGSCGRRPGDVTLVAVSKTFPAEAVAGLAGVGPVVLGESRVQEAAGKIAALAGLPVTWHLIGHLQSNKANRAAELFSMVHSVDDVPLLQRLERRCADLGKGLDALVEVNLGGEDAKSGCTAETLPAILDAACGLKHVRVRGFMTLPPWCDDPEDARPFFARLRELRDRFAPRYEETLDLRELSMGMSHDFEAAIAEGATMVRVGTAIFGDR
ncbi:MAG: YggS family pyridoxal phosphate-dependent enzyme [Acidobacteria bacterium]|nr:YggS family pyridoxal phosphate-dependent enzyme [Acidobacteriota bacterium]